MINVEWNPFEIGNDSKSSEFFPAKDGLESIKSKLDFLTNERDASFLRPFFIELIQHIENHLRSIKNYTRISRGKISKDLPETTVPGEPLRNVLGSVLVS